MAAAMDTLDREARNRRSEAARKERLVADPTVGVSDLIKPTQLYLSFKGDKDLWGLIAPPEGGPSRFSWTTRPKGDWMAKLAGFMYDLAGVASNTKVSSTKLIAALKSLHADGRIVNVTKQSDSAFFDRRDDGKILKEISAD